MSSDSDSLVGAGQRALAAGEWSAARNAFEAALELEETPEALLGLGNALWWMDEAEASLRCRERAYAGFRHRADAFQAAATALQLAAHYGANLGDVPAARGWGARAARLVEEFELDPLKGWVLLSQAAGATMGGDPDAGEGFARRAHELARRLGDNDLELCSLSQIGGALVMRGRVEEGVMLLDEAMAGALSGEAGPETVVHASCVTMVCCNRAAELKRAAQWIRAADEFNRRYGSPHLDAVCRTAYGEVLIATGRWEEAARLLDGIEERPATTYVTAAIHLARRELAPAVSILRRRLRTVGQASLESALLLELLIEVEVEQGAHEAALDEARRLAALGAASSCDVIAARAERALGRALVATGEPDGATAHLERAFGALASLDALGAAHDADAAAAFLRTLGVHPARSGPRNIGGLTRRELEVLSLLGEGLSNPQMAERLFLSRKTVEHHVASVLSKLEQSGRAEAAAYAVRHLERGGSAIR